MMYEKQPKYKIVKLTVGVASVLVGTQILSSPLNVNAEETSLDATTIIEQLTAEEKSITNDTLSSKDNVYQLEIKPTCDDETEQNDEYTVESSEIEKVQVGLTADDERTSLFVEDWQTVGGDLDIDELEGANWESLDLPHDFSIDKQFSTDYEAESGFLPGGVQWYQKSFFVDDSIADKHIRLEFDGSYMLTDVYLNGKQLGHHAGGYTSFAYNLTDYLNKNGKENVFSVRVENELPSSRWYSGSGIYRDVKITVGDPLHVDYYGTKIEAHDLEVSQHGEVETTIATKVVNSYKEDKSFNIINSLLNANGEIVATTTSDDLFVKAGEKVSHINRLCVDKPTLWSIDNPYLYKLQTEILLGNKVVDTVLDDFGFRYFDFDRDTGFSLNGKNMKLKGVSMHHDQGALGAVANPAAIERQVMMLKEMGANAIRSTHNPAAQTLVEMANKHGMLIIDEAFDGWDLPKNGNYNDFSKHFNQKIGPDNLLLNSTSDMTWAEYVTKQMVHAGKNAPSIIMWSIGNEITEGATGNASHYPEIARNIMDWIEEIDQTRKLTIGDNRTIGSGDYAILHEIHSELHRRGGVIGKNYKNARQMQAERDANPEWLMYGAETASAIHTRGAYQTFGKDDERLEMSAYNNDSARVGWGASASKSWQQVIENDWNAGEFVWTGFDYIGEPTPWNGIGSGSVSQRGATPNSSFFGIIDTAGLPKDTYYLYRSLWNANQNTLHVMPTWNEEKLVKTNDGKVQVDVFSNAHKVELYINGTLVDTQEATEYSTEAGYTYLRFGQDQINPYATFMVDFEPGEIYAVGYDKEGKVLETNEQSGRNYIRTASSPTQLKLVPNRSEISADGRDLVYVRVDVQDENGNLVPYADNRIHFSVEGPGRIVGVDNGHQADLDSYKADNRRALNGHAIVIIQAGQDVGEIKVTAQADKLVLGQTVINSIKPQVDTSYLQNVEYSKNYYLAVGTQFSFPKAIQVKYSDGKTEQVPVQWEGEEDFDAKQIGVKTYVGSIEGTNYKPQITLHVIETIVALENISGSTRLGSIPALPSVMKALNNKGELLAGDYPVEWDLKEVSFDTPGIVTVQGTSVVLGKKMPVVAKIRVSNQAEARNLAAKDGLTPPLITNGYIDQDGQLIDLGDRAISDSLLNLNNGVVNDGANTNQRWTNWSLRNEDPQVDVYLEFAWNEAQAFNNMNIWHFTDTGSSVLPQENIWFEYLDQETDEWIHVEHSNITQVPYTNGTTTYTLIPNNGKNYIETSNFRVWVRSPQVGKTVGFTEIEILSYVTPLTNASTTDITELVVNGQVIELIEGQTTYEIQDVITDVQAVATDNASITLVSGEKGRVIVRVKSEDGKSVNSLVLNGLQSEDCEIIPPITEPEDIIEFREEVILFETQEIEDATLMLGERKVIQEGINGKVRVTYTNGEETDRVVLTNSVPKIILVGTKEVPEVTDPQDDVEVREEIVPFETQEVKDEKLPMGERKIVQKGMNGKVRITYINGEEVERITLVDSVTEVVHIGVGVMNNSVDQDKENDQLSEKNETSLTENLYKQQSEHSTEREEVQSSKVLPETGEATIFYGVASTILSALGLGLVRRKDEEN